MINANPLPALNPDEAFKQWRIEHPRDVELPTTTYEAFLAGYNAALSALAEAGLVRNREPQ